MARSLDGLIHHLLDRIALCGEHGALPSDFIAYVRSYYDSPEKAVVANEDQPTTQKPSNAPNVDRLFLEQVWKWLTGHPEIRLGDHAGHKRLTLSNVEARNAPIEHSGSSELVSKVLQHEGAVTAPQGPTSVANIHDGLASQKPKSSGLTDTAAQSETAVEATQDSVTAMADEGSGEDTQKDEVTARPSTSEKPTLVTEVLTHNLGIRLYASENRMWHALTGHGPDLNKVRPLDFACLSLIAASGPKGIYQNDLVRKSGQDKRSVPLRTDRLYEDGYIEKERVCVQLFNPKRIMHTSRLVLKRFAKETTNQTEHPEQSKLAAALVEKDTGEIKNLDNGQEIQLSGQMNPLHEVVSKLERPVPQWIPDRPLSNQIFDLVERSGTQGMSMNDIRDNLFGEYVRRPTVEYVTRLGECWQMSQPLHLRHLSIIRDTVLKGKGSIFNYYTYESFEKLVEKGIGFWEAVVTVPDDLTAGSNFAASLDAVQQLDNFGFPVIESNLFCGSDNNATLQECASALNADTFRYSGNGPGLQRKAHGTYDLQSSRPNAASRKPKVPKPDIAFSPARPPKSNRSTQMGVGVKPRGRPRKYPTNGAPIDLDKMDIDAIRKVNRSREMAEKYAKSKIEQEVSRRIAAGGDAVLVTSGVLDEVESLRKEAGQEPLSNHTKGMILHTFAGGPQPASLNQKRTHRGQPKTAPYWPSMAAHTFLVPDPRRSVLLGSIDPPYRPSTAAHTMLVLDHRKRVLLGSKDPLKPKRKADNPRKRGRRPPAHSPEPEIGADNLPAKKKRRRKAVSDDTSVVPYWPSIAAHSWPNIPPPSLIQEAPQEKAKRKPGRPRKEIDPMAPRPQRKKPYDLRFRYFPSIYAHSGSFLPPLPLPTVQLPRRKGISQGHVQHSAAIITTASPPTQLHYLPSIAAHSPSCLPTYITPPVQATKAKNVVTATAQDDEAPAKPASQTSATWIPLASPPRGVPQTSQGLHVGPYPEGFYPGWVKYMLRYYEPDLKNIVRNKDGVYLGKTKHRRKRNTEPVGFRPLSYKLVVFKFARLRGMPWFMEKAEAPQRAPSGLAKGQSLRNSPKTALSRPSKEQSDVLRAGKSSSQELIYTPCLLHDLSPLTPASGSSSQHWRPSPCYLQDKSDLPPARHAFQEPEGPVNGSSVSTSPYSQSPPVRQLDSHPRTDYASPYTHATGIKRKREGFDQPHRGSTPPQPLPMNSYSGYGCLVQTMLSPEYSAPHTVQKNTAPASENLDPRNTQDANVTLAEASSPGIGTTTFTVEKVPSATERIYTTIEKATSPISENSPIAGKNPSVSTTVRISPLSVGKEALPIGEKTQAVNVETHPVAEKIATVVDGTALIVDEAESHMSAHIDGMDIVLGRLGATPTSSTQSSTPPNTDKHEVVSKNTASPIQIPSIVDSRQNDGGSTPVQSSMLIGSPLTPNISSKGQEQSIDRGNSPTKSPRPQENAMTSISATTGEIHYSGRENIALQNQGQSKSPITKCKPVRGRKFFGKMNRQGGSVAMLRKKVVLEIIDKCGGVYPGHKELIKAFVIEWEKKGLEGGTPEEKTMQNTVDALCNEGKLQQIKFIFKDKKGLKVKKDMLMYPSIDVMDPRVKDVQRRVIAHHPRFFWPSAVVPPDEYSVTTQKMMDGKERVQDAKYTALIAQDQLAQTERSGQNGSGGGPSAQPTSTESEQILRVPYIPQSSPSRMRSLDGSRPRGGGRGSRVERLASFRKPWNMEISPLAATIQPPLPKPVSTATNNSKSLLWLPESYAFSEFNYEEERPTVLEPTIRDNHHRRHARYGMQMDPPKATRGHASENSVNHRTKRPMVSFGQNQAMKNHKRLSPLYSDFRSNYPLSLLSMHSSSPLSALQSNNSYARSAASQLGLSSYISPYASTSTAPPTSALQSQKSYGRPAASHLDYSTYNPPYTGGANGQKLALRAAEAGQSPPVPNRKPVFQAPDMFSPENLGHTGNTVSPTSGPSGTGAVLTWLPVEQTHNFRPCPKELIVNFMDAFHYFHQSSGTFSVGFSGFAPPRQINKSVGTCSKPYSYGSRTIHPEFPAQRGPRNILPKRSLEDEDTQFEKEVDGLLRWELESKGWEHAKFGPSTFINHVFSHVHTTVEAVDANMDQVKGVIIQSDGGRIINRRLAIVNTIRQRTSDSIPNSGPEVNPTAAAEVLRRTEVRAPLKRRRLTTLVEGRSQEESSETVQLDVDNRPAKFRRVRGPREARLLHRDDERRLLTAIMIVRTLTGGLEEHVDWALVAKVFSPTYEKKFIAQRWPYIRGKFKLALSKMEAEFQEMFAKAYEEGSVPALDFDNLEHYDWKWLTQWTLDHLGTWSQSQPDLPAERTEFNNLYTLKDTSEVDINDYYGINGTARHTAAKRASVMASSPYVYPMKHGGIATPTQDKDQPAIAKSWVRANFITPSSTYKPDDASAKLGTMPDQVMEDALRQLVSDQVLSQENKGRLIPGRNYYINDHLTSRLRKNLLPEHFHRAVAFKQRLDEGFAEKRSVPFPFTAADGDTLAMINLLAHKRIKLVSVNLPLNEWGQVDGGYETRRMDKNRLNFQVEMQALPSYVAGNPLEPVPAPPSQHLQDPMAKIPLWYGICGDLVPVMWEMALAAVMAVLAVRPGVGAEEIEKATRPAMEAWEIEKVLVWLVEAKAATRVESGYILDEWWWLALPGGGGGEAEIDPLIVQGQPVEIDGLSNRQRLDKGKGKEKEAGGPPGPQDRVFAEFQNGPADDRVFID